MVNDRCEQIRIRGALNHPNFLNDFTQFFILLLQIIGCFCAVAEIHLPRTSNLDLYDNHITNPNDIRLKYCQYDHIMSKEEHYGKDFKFYFFLNLFYNL